MLSLSITANIVVLLCLIEVSKQGAVQVSTGEQFIAGLESAFTSVDQIILVGDVRITAEDLKPAQTPLLLPSNRTLNITSGGSTRLGAWVLDLGSVFVQVLYLEPNSTLRFSNVRVQAAAPTFLGRAAGLPTEMPLSPLWPTVDGASQHQVIFEQVMVEALSEACTPEQVAAHAEALIAKLDLTSEELSYNGTTIWFHAPLTEPVPLLRRGTNETVGVASYTYVDTIVTFECPSKPVNATASAGKQASSSGSYNWRAPVVGTIIGAAAVAALAAGWLLWLRHKRRRELQPQGPGSDSGGIKLPEVVLPIRPLESAGRTESGRTSHTPLSEDSKLALSATIWHSRVGLIEGLELADLVGSGSFGRCYRGRWKGAPVAVKVMEQRILPGKCHDLYREPLLSMTVSHPNVVQSFKLQVLCVRADRDPDTQCGIGPTAGLSRDTGGQVSSGRSQQQQQQQQGAGGGSGSSSSRVSSGRGAQVVAMQGAGSTKGSNGVRHSRSKASKGGDQGPTAASSAAAGAAIAEAAAEPSLLGQEGEQQQPSAADGAMAGGVVVSPEGPLPPGLYETWLVMEYCDRGNLTEAIAAGRFLDPNTHEPNQVFVLLSLLDIAQGLEYLHSLNILHGDLKGRNILLKSARMDRRGFVLKLADFGLSRMMTGHQTHIQTQSYGTASHAAPELLQHHMLTKAADVFSYALIMWELLAGEEAYTDMSALQIILQVTQHGYRLPVPEACPPQLGRLMERCWAADPHCRPGFGEVVEELRRMLRERRQS